MSEMPKLVPLGTVFVARGSSRRFMVVARALSVEVPGEGRRLFDYGCCLWPDGLVGDALAYMNSDQVERVVFAGLADEGEERMLVAIAEAVASAGLERGDPGPLVSRRGEGAGHEQGR